MTEQPQGTEHTATPQVVPDAPEQNKGISVIGEGTIWLFTDEESNRIIEAANKLRDLEIRLTKPEDWVAFGEGVHLQDSRLGELTTYLQSLFGINVTILPPTVQKENFKAYRTITVNNKKQEVEIDVIEWIYTGGVKVEEVREVQGRIRRVRIIEPITGSCRTDDKLWTKKFGESLDPAHVQPSMVMKKAQANYRGNCYRYVWGLKGLDKTMLKTAGLDITRIKDSGIRDPKGQMTGDQRDVLGKLWIRVLEANGQSADKAKDWLAKTTGYKGGTNRETGQPYEGFDGYRDIYRVKPGSKSFTKIEKALEQTEKNQAAASTQESHDTQAGEQSAGQAFMAYQRELGEAKTSAAIHEIDKRIVEDKRMSKVQIQSLQRVSSQRLDVVMVADENGGGARA